MHTTIFVYIRTPGTEKRREGGPQEERRRLWRRCQASGLIHHGRFRSGCVVMRPGNRAKLLAKQGFGVWYGARVQPGLISIEPEEIAPTFRAFLDFVLDQAPGNPPVNRIFPQMMMPGKLPSRYQQTRPPPGNIIAWFPALGAGPIWAGQGDGGGGRRCFRPGSGGAPPGRSRGEAEPWESTPFTPSGAGLTRATPTRQDK